MKLRYIANIRLPTEKAHGIQIMSMCAAFASAGAEVELLVPDRHNKINDDPFVFYKVLRNFKIRKIKTFDLTRYERIFGKYAFFLQAWSFARAVLRDARDNPADIYYHRDEMAFRSFAEAGLSSVWELHKVPGHLDIYRRALDKARALVTISKGIANALVAFRVPENKIIVAPDGVDLEQFSSLPDRDESRAKFGFSQNEIVALYTGQLYPWKGVDTLVEAAAGLPENVAVAIVGGGAGRLEELKEKARRIGSRCRFFGQVKHEEVPAFLAAADIVVIPNSGKEEISRSYTSPLKLFEAMAAGKAIIVSDLPSMREVLDESVAVFFRPDDAASLREKIITMARDRETLDNLATRARERSNGYSWEARAEAILRQISI